MTGLIDGDIVAYRAAASCEKRDSDGNLLSLEPIEIALLRTDKTMRDILALEEDHITFLSDKTNFRYQVNPEYKAHRKGRPKPEWLVACKDYLIEEYKAIVTDNIEADDALGIYQTDSSIIYSIDKDLLMIPGCHYNFVKQLYSEVTELEGIKTFYKQMLIGDTADNIIGVSKIGKVKAAKLIDPLESETEMFELVQHLYEEGGDTNMDRFWMNADCLWIMQEEGVTFSKRYENNKKSSTEGSL